MKWIASAALLAQLQGCGGGAQPAPFDAVNSSDDDPVTMVCDKVFYIVSLNDDDDDRDHVEDLKRTTPPPKEEDNLRPLLFHVSGAVSVKVFSPTDIPKGAPASQVRSWDGAKTAPFVYGAALPTSDASPLKIFHEGIKKTKIDQLGFEYEYYKDANGTEKLCAGSALFSVIKVDFHGKPKHGLTDMQKLLALATLDVTATVDPAIAKPRYEWNYDATASGTLKPADKIASAFTATKVYTGVAARDKSHVRFKVADTRQPGAPIALREILNITAPRSVGAIVTPLANDSASSTQGIANMQAADATTFSLYHWPIAYTIKDQFQDEMKETEFANTAVVIREDIQFKSGIAKLEQWSQKNATVSPKWEDPLSKKFPKGTFIDTMSADGLPFGTVMDLRGGRIVSLTQPVGTQILSLDHHVWHVSVSKSPDDKDLDKTVTDNQLDVKVTDFKHDSAKNFDTAKYHAVYTIKLTP